MATGSGRAGRATDGDSPGPEQVMSDASPNKPVESVEEKQKVEEKVASKPVEQPAARDQARPSIAVANLSHSVAKRAVVSRCLCRLSRILKNLCEVVLC